MGQDDFTGVEMNFKSLILPFVSAYRGANKRSQDSYSMCKMQRNKHLLTREIYVFTIYKLCKI